ncbi:MAG: winged helix-turn-helix domain-containing protein [Dermatophilaceae bacterium]
MSRSPEWTFMSNHGHVLVALARGESQRIRDLADAVGITDRAVQDILQDLVDAEFVVRTREGRRNSYRVVRRSRFRHPLESQLTVGAFLDLVEGSAPV